MSFTDILIQKQLDIHETLFGKNHTHSGFIEIYVFNNRNTIKAKGLNADNRLSGY